MSMSRLQDSIFSKQKIKTLRVTPHIKKCIFKLLEKEKCPTLTEVTALVGCDNAKAELILKSIKIKRKQLSSALMTTLPGMRKTGKEGFIYLIEHELYPGWVKCGMTISLDNRLKSYNGYDPMSRFKFIQTKEVNDRRLSEKCLIKQLKYSANLEKGEWFKIDKDKILEIFNKI